MSVCPPKGGMARGSPEGLNRREAGLRGWGLAAREGKGCGRQRAWSWAAGPQGWEREPRGGRGGAGEGGLIPDCLDTAIIVSSEHPGSAGSAERELNKEPGEEESGEKSARGAGSSPVGLFLCPATLLCAPPPRKPSSEMPDGDAAPPGPRGPALGHRVGLGEGEAGVLEGGRILHLFIWRAVAMGTEFPEEKADGECKPTSPHPPAVQRWTQSTLL